MRILQPDLELMRTEEVFGCKLVSFAPIKPSSTAGLTVKEPSLGSVDQKFEGLVILRGDVDVVAFVAELRGQNIGFSHKVAILAVNLISTLMEVPRRRLRCKSVQSQVIEFLRIHGNGHSRGLLRANGEVKLGIRVEALQRRVSLQRRETVDRCAYVTIFERLRECDSILKERTGECHARRCRPYSNDAAISLTRPRQNVLNRKVILLVVTGLRFNTRNRTCQLSVLWIIGIGNDLHRRNYVDGNADGRTASDRVSDIDTVHKRSALGVAGPLQVYQPIRTANYARYERQ